MADYSMGNEAQAVIQPTLYEANTGPAIWYCRKRFDADQLMDLLSDDILNHCDVNAMLDDLIVLDLARQLDARLKNCLGLARDSFWNNRSTPTPPRYREHKRHTGLAS